FLDVPVVRPVVTETTVLGAAYAAGLATGVWSGQAELRDHWKADRRFTPAMSNDDRSAALALWAKAVERTLGWT
ncbi:MAG TPA: glycerol kinase, partial [Candidatus Limnocylindrales bacterium]